MIRVLVFLFFCVSIVLATTKVPVAKLPINWKSRITSNNVQFKNISSVYKCKKYLNIDKVKSNKLRAKHYILKNKPICADDVYMEENKKVVFKFGSLEIEKDGEIIKETSKYIKIKNLDGTIEKIYKDELGQ